MHIRFRIALFVLLVAAAVDARAGARRAVIIGIDDYTASSFPRPAALPDRDWANLGGAVRDAGLLRDLLVLLYRFEPKDVVLLTDQAATRSAILQALEEHLLIPAAKGDVLFFYFAGHGSQVANSLSEEPDKLDESIVPADSRAGAMDIRDKELRRLFNRILDRGARLSVLLDSCHSGSGARGLLTGAPRARAIAPDLRDVMDAADAGPRPEERGALVLAATRDYDIAVETRDGEGALHGSFSWAWMQALRDSAEHEPVTETFLRAQARMRADKPFQEPALAGNEAARSTPFLGGQNGRGERNVVAVERVLPDGTVLLRGGWANGLAVGATLRALHDEGAGWKLTVTAIHGVGRSEGRLAPGRSQPPPLRPGALLEVVGWAAPAGRPLRVWIPRVASGPNDQLSLAQRLGVESTKSADDADYILVGRYAGERTEYAWMRSGARDAEAQRSALPVRSDWVREGRDAAKKLRTALLRLRRIHAWQLLESPPASRSPYRLALRSARNGEVPPDGAVVGGESYELVMRASAGEPQAQPRFFYAFVIDRYGRSILLSPRGSVENRFPLPGQAGEIPLARFTVRAPYGVDTYFLLSTDEPLPNPWILQWDGIRSRSPKSPTPLERLLMLTASGKRAGRIVTPVDWSIERVVHQSVPPPVKRMGIKRH